VLRVDINHPTLVNSQEHIMEQIIAGRFDSFTEANAAAVLLNQYIDTDDICIFYNSPPGQHGVLPAGGDETADPEAENAHSYALATGATVGAAAGAVGLFGGPIVALAAAGVGAYTGSLLGAMGGMNHKSESSKYARRQAGVLVAVHLTDPNDEQRIISTLKKEHAEDIEHAQGKWHNGDWVDFDPVKPPHLTN
jgi:hypothetical protein